MKMKNQVTESTKEEIVVVSYKGFDKNLCCAPNGNKFQYEVGKLYEQKGLISACEKGFHACEFPLSVLSYYGLKDGNRYAVVEQSGRISKKVDKTVSSKITVKAEIGIPGLIKASVEWVMANTSFPTSGDSAHSATSGNYAYSATSGNYAHSATSGYSANSATSGDYANSATSGDSAHSATSGYSAHSATSGNYAYSATSGDSAHSATSGNYAHSATSGNSAHSATSGYSAHSATSGDYANSATSGDSAHSATSGNYAHSATSGNYAHSATSGDYANSATSGYSALSSAKGSHAVAANAGNSAAMAGLGGAIFIVERDSNLKILAVFASLVGENGIKADIWYRLKNGKPVECTP